MHKPAGGEKETAGDLTAKLDALIGRLEKEADSRVSKRQNIEQRWLKDLRQYHGCYDEETLKDLVDSEKSELFINQTRPKTNACAARLFDMLFPTDDRNWGIKPTPIPSLSRQASETLGLAQQQAEVANQAIESGKPEQAKAIVEQANAQIDVGQQARAILEEAKKRAEAMTEELDDQLTECGYAQECRDAIEDACKLGTGVLEGPVVSDRVRRSWRKRPGPDGTQIDVLEESADPRPGFRRVDPWGFFPQSDALNPEESESFYVRHLLTAKQMRKLAREPGFDKDAIREILNDGVKQGSVPTYLGELKAITGDADANITDRYTVWQYRGPLTAEEMRDLCLCLGKQEMAPEEDVDPLKEMNVVLWFCQGKCLKFGIHHLDSGDAVYSVFPLEKDDASMFGIGIPALMRDSQSALNAAWRMMMDNAGLSTGPQIELDPSVIEPVDSEWALTARKLWKRKVDADPGKPGLITHDINSHQGELAGIIELAKQFIDDETNMPIIAQGEQGSHTTKTAHGMSILMNSVNVVFRRIVKNFDDRMTRPNIRRLYDWNMQFSQKEEIKGDFEVDARGSSVLLVREIQSQNLMTLVMNWSAHPVLAGLLKVAPAARKTVQSFMIAADDILKTDDELKQEAQEAANNPPPEDPAITLKRMELEDKELERQHKERLAAVQRDTEMVKLSAQTNVTLDKIRASLQDSREERASKERTFAAEVAVEKQNKDEAVARGDEPQGSGGFISQ